MSRGRKKVSAEEVIAHADEIEPPQTEFYAVEGEEVTKEEFAEKVQEVTKEEPAVVETKEPEVEETVIETDNSTIDVVDKDAVMAFVKSNLIQHSNRRPGSVSGMMPPAYRLTLKGGRVRFFTLPIQVEEFAVEDGWKRCRRFMTAEEYVAFVIRVLGISPPPFYSTFRVISLD